MSPLRRLRSFILASPEPAEVLTNAMAIGWALAFCRYDARSSSGTTVGHVVDALGAYQAAAWMVLTAILPPVSIAFGRRTSRLLSTFLCSAGWSTIIVVSAGAGLPLSPTVAVAACCIISLSWSQWRLLCPGPSLECER